MNSHLDLINAKARAEALRTQAQLSRLDRRDPRPRSSAPVVIRAAGAGDEAALARLAALEGVRPFDGNGALVAEENGEVLAAVSLDGDAPVADPFRPTAELVELLQLRLTHLHGGRSPGRRLLRSLFSRASGRRRPGATATAPATPGNGTLLIG